MKGRRLNGEHPREPTDDEVVELVTTRLIERHGQRTWSDDEMKAALKALMEEGEL